MSPATTGSRRTARISGPAARTTRMAGTRSSSMIWPSRSGPAHRNWP